MMKFIAITCCRTCGHMRVEQSSCHTNKTCDLDGSKTDGDIMCGKWAMSEDIKALCGKD
jgi:hypothetical protein